MIMLLPTRATRQILSWIFSTCAAFIIAVSLLAPSAVANLHQTTTGSMSELPLDENGRMASQTLVYPSGPCASLIEDEFVERGGKLHKTLVDLRPVHGDAERIFFPDGVYTNHLRDGNPTRVQDCRAICVQKGVAGDLAPHAMPHLQYHGSGSFSHWFHGDCLRTEIGFINYYDKENPLLMYWKDGDVEKLDAEIKYGERNTICFHSFLGHEFVFRNHIGEIVFEYSCEHVSMIAIGGRDLSPVTYSDTRNFTRDIKHTLYNEWKRSAKVTRSFSELGFQKGRLPDDIFASMGAFYYNNRHNKVREEWDGKGVFVNWWETEVYFIQVPWMLKEMWQGRLLELVQEWVGVELEQTDMYGLRRYEEGARLITHVDRESTHAASLIINVAQGSLTEPWPVEVGDHAHRLHEVTMEPGDIVYYESAKCLHARNKPLRGAGSYYVNLFTHYRPKGDPEWYKRPNPEGTAEPLLDVGECRLEGPPEVGVGAAKCDNDAIGPYLSPTLFKASGGHDLFRWWNDVGPDSTEGEGEGEGGHDEL